MVFISPDHKAMAISGGGGEMAIYQTINRNKRSSFHLKDPKKDTQIIFPKNPETFVALDLMKTNTHISGTILSRKYHLNHPLTFRG